MAITSTESLLALLEKSQLLTAPDLEKVHAVAGKYADAKALARALVAAKGVTRWQAGQLLAGRSSFTLGKYRLVDLLGRGGMGSVFAAEHKTLGRRVALKIISKQTGRDPEQLERFLEEARRIAALDHPNIVRAFDVDHEGERYFLVLEYVEGRDLQQIVESDGPLDVERAVRFTRQAALGLAHAHERKMIHCDIKPANLIVGKDDVVKILDMGMARLVESDGSSSDSNENIVGTIDYIAPEQALDAEDLDHRVDIYSLGCSLYFLLTSRPPFGEGTLAQRIMKHQTQNPRPISETRSGVPDGLADICSKMMAKKPGDRYQTAAEVAQALERWTGVKAAAAAVKNAPDNKPAAPIMDDAPNDEPGAVIMEDSPDDEAGPAVVELIADDDASGDQDDGEVSISVVDSGSFSVRAGSSRGRRPPALKKTVKETPDPGESVGFFADPRKKWATIIVAGLLILAGAVGGLLMQGGGHGEQGATAGDNVASAETVPTTASAAKVPASEPEFDSDLADLEGTFGSSGDDAEDKPPEAPEPAPGSGDKSAMPAEPEGAEATSDQSKVEESEKPAKEEPEGKDGDKPSKPADATPKPAEKKEEKKPEKKPDAEKKEEPKKEPPKKAPPKVEPFKDFPKAFNIPVLSGNDSFGEASKAPVVLGTIRGPASVNWQMLLVGGDKVLKGGRKFVLARTEADASKAAWSVQLSGGSSDSGPEDVARLWRDIESLKFQWAEEAPAAVANYLRNCILQVRVAGGSRYAALVEPIQAEPIVLDLLRGQSNSSVAVRWAPDEELLRFKLGPVEGFEKATFDPAEPVAPKTQVTLNFVYTDKHENDSNAVIFRVLPTSRKTSLNLDLRLQFPTALAFKNLVGNYTESQLGVMLDHMGNNRTGLERKMKNLKGGEAHKTTLEIDDLSRQMWYYDFFLKTHKKAALHYQVVADMGGQELVLVTTK